MIVINVVDPDLKIELSEDVDFHITSTSDYVQGYNRIANALHNNQKLHVRVSDKKVGRWFRNMAKKYGEEEITLEIITPKTLFQSQTGITEIPENITDNQILESGLLDLKIPSSEYSTFEDYLLKVFFGKFMTIPNGLHRVDEIVTNFEPEQWQEAMSIPLIRDVYRSRVRSMRENLLFQGKRADLQLLEWMEVSPKVYIKNLFSLKILDNYPVEVGEKVFGEIYSELKSLNLDLRKIPITLSGNEEVIKEVQLYLELITSILQRDTFKKLIEEVSGFLDIEFKAIQQFIEYGKLAITKQDIKKIQHKFQPLITSPGISQALSDLEMLIPKEKPSEPEMSWEAEEWINWAVNEYLPYRFWLENTGQLDDKIGEIANQYAEWFYENYGNLLYHSNYMAWKALLNLKDDIKSFPGKVLVIVVDNFNMKFYSEFRSKMHQQGFYEQGMQHCFSLIPSCTEVSKKAIITGHFAPFEQTGYENQVESVWGKRLGKKVKYFPDISALRDVTKLEHDVFFLNYLPLDITLHQNENQLGISHSFNIRNYLHLLVQDISAFAVRLGIERDLMVIVTSDHGSTCIPKGTINVIQKKYYQQRTDDSHHRYIVISDKELENLPDNIKYDCYLIKKGTYGLARNYLIARRLYRFLSTDDHAYIHGGVTPEETIIPLAIFQPATITPKPVELILLGSRIIFVGTKVNLQLEITNINNYPCENVSIEFNDTNIEAQDIFIEIITKLNRTTINIQGRCPNSANPSAKSLDLDISFEFLGKVWEFHYKLPVQIKELAKTKFNLDNL